MIVKLLLLLQLLQLAAASEDSALDIDNAGGWASCLIQVSRELLHRQSAIASAAAQASANTSKIDRPLTAEFFDPQSLEEQQEADAILHNSSANLTSLSDIWGVRLPAENITDAWQIRSVNGTMTCKDPGCTANQSITVFDPSTEQATFCHLSLLVHNTDFDDLYSGERLTEIRANGHVVNTDCFPMASGCSATEPRPLFPCLTDLPVDAIWELGSGSVRVSASIPDVVDECPMNGNMLSTIPIVTCLVRPIPPTTTTTPPPPAPPPQPQNRIVQAPQQLLMGAPIRCAERNCTAKAELLFNRSGTEVVLSNCKLNLTLNQTDYDGEEGTPENVEFVKVDGKTLATNVSPGKNPCSSVRAGVPLTAAQTSYDVLKGVDVTDNAMNGTITVEVKIDDHVDECAYEGYLLSGWVYVACTLTEVNSIWPQELASINQDYGTDAYD